MRWIVGVFAALCVLSGCVLAGCGSSRSSGSGSQSDDVSTVESSGGGSAILGALRIDGAYVPQPASPAAAAAYFTIHNTGDSADTLTGISTPVSAMAMMHSYTSTGPGTEKMTMLDAVKIPPHRRVRLVPGKMHVMLENPKRSLKQGDTVALTLVFARAGKVTLKAPVTSIGRGLQG